MVDVPAYLARINYSGPTEPNIEALRALHRAHLFTVPFENLDIALGRKIVVDPDACVRKVVEQRRGGFCYELNGAFAALLEALGFRVTLLSARVAREKGGEGPEFDHLTLRVDLGELWLADVGFGDSFLEPLALEAGTEQVDPVGKFRLTQLPATVEEQLQLERAQPDGSWKRQYSFTLQRRQITDFADMCRHHQTSPESSFTQNSICSRATPDGRITLSGTKLIVTRNGHREERELVSEQERKAVLLEFFGINL
ncbi:MAG: arylamine N-acetyltransferase family protein [Candidatus Sulfotelmatobacter sp.]